MCMALLEEDRLAVGIGESDDRNVRAMGLVRGTQVGGDYNDLVHAAKAAVAGGAADHADAAAVVTEREKPGDFH